MVYNEYYIQQVFPKERKVESPLKIDIINKKEIQVIIISTKYVCLQTKKDNRSFSTIFDTVVYTLLFPRICFFLKLRNI